MKRTKKILSIILSVLMIMSAMPITVFANDTELTEPKAVADDYEYTVIDEAQKIAEITEYNGNDTSVTIPDSIDGYTIISIGDNAFYECANIETVSFGDNVASIGESAFEKCRALKNVFVPSDVTSVGNNAFNDCSNELVICAKGDHYGTPTALEKYTDDNDIDFVDINGFKYTVVDESQKTAKIHAYWYMDPENFMIPEKIDGYTIVAIDDNAYANRIFVRFFIPNTVEKIGNNAFKNCVNLKQIDIPISVKTIGAYAFYNCKQATGTEHFRDVSLSGRVESIGEKAFGYYVENGVEMKYSGDNFIIHGYKNSVAEKYANDKQNNFTFVPFDFSYTLESDGTAAINGYYGNSDDVVVPSVIDGYNVSTLAENAFRDQTFVNLVISEGITTIRKMAVVRCQSLITASLPSTVRNIEEHAFALCFNLESINLPEGLETIPAGLFMASAIKNITIPKSVKLIKRLAFENCEKLESLVIPGTVEEIEHEAFRGCSSLKNLTLETGIKTIGNEAFRGCNSLESLTIPSSITNMGDGVFSGCGSLKTVVVEEGIKELSYGLFSYDEKLESVSLPSTLEHIGRTFENCTALETIDLPENISSISDYAFCECTGLKSITIPSNVKTINANTFLGCTGLISVKLSDGLESIQDGAFRNCTSLVNIEFPDSLKAITGRAFENCTALETVDLPKNLVSIDGSVFYECTGLKSIVIPDSVTTLGGFVFRHCSSLESVVLSKNIDKIEVGSFFDCTSLKDVFIPEGITIIESFAFLGCDQLKSVIIPESVTFIDEYALGYDAETKKIDGFTIYGIEGSAAEKYANDNGFTFIKHRHTWVVKDCLKPRECSKCGQKEDYVYGHDYRPYELVEDQEAHPGEYKAKCFNCGELVDYMSYKEDYNREEDLTFEEAQEYDTFKPGIKIAPVNNGVAGTMVVILDDKAITVNADEKFTVPNCTKCVDKDCDSDGIMYLFIETNCVFAYPTCVKGSECIFCGNTIGESDPDAHNYKLTINDNIYTYTCKICGDTYTVDKQALAFAISTANCEYINTGVADKQYVSIEALQNAVENAQAVFDSETVTQAEVNNAASSIQTAISELELKQYTVTVSKEVYGNNATNNISVPYGEMFNYTVELGENEAVYKWIMSVDGRDVRLNTIDQSISQVITDDTTFICYVDDIQSEQGDTARVVFYDKGNRVIKLDYVQIGSAVDMDVEAPKVAFYDFVGWETVSGDPSNVDKSGVALRAAYAPKNIAANKSTIVGLNGVKVNGKDAVTEFYDTRITLTGAESYAYCDKDGNILQGINGNIIYAPNNSQTIYVCAGTSNKASTSITGTVDDTKKLTINAQYYLPSDCTVVEAGVVVSPTVENPTLNTAGCVSLKSSQQGKSGEYSISLTYSRMGTINAASYLTYKDNQGTLHTIYSDTSFITYGA